MNILQINSHDNVGGASKAAHRLYSGLKRVGLQSRMLVYKKHTSGDPDIQAIETEPGIFSLWNRLVNQVAVKMSIQAAYSPTTYKFIKHPWVSAADVVNLHNIQGNFFAYPGLKQLSHQVPVVWTLHDMWGFTGHCGYSFDCDRWIKGCGQCPYLATPPAITRDTTDFQWRLKNRVYEHSHLSIVTPSKWLAQLVQSSPLLGRFPVHCIPNSVNTEIFQPIEKKVARKELGIPLDGFYLLFLATPITGKSVLRKGADLAITALRQLPDQFAKLLKVLLVGNRGEEWQTQLSCPSYLLGHIESEKRMALCYAAADAFVLPTRQDNLPNTLLESLACGTPCVSFNVGGVSDAVRHLQTGYLAQPGEAQDLANGMVLLMENAKLKEHLSTQARTLAQNEYALHVQARRYKELYASLIT